MLTFSILYRTHGLRVAGQMVKPPLTPLAKLTLPLDSTFHYTTSDDDCIGIEPTDPILANFRGDVVTEHVNVFSEYAIHGNPRLTSVNASELERDYNTRFKRFKRLATSASLLKQPKALLVVNYGILDRRYRYIETFLTPYQHWCNRQVTLVDSLKRHMLNNTRQQFLTMRLPDNIPPLSRMVAAEKLISKDTLRVFNSPTMLGLLDLWKWLGENRAASFLGALTPEECSRVNLIWLSGVKWTVINLGVLDGWIKDKNKEDNKGASISHVDAQKRLLMFLMAMQQEQTVILDAPITAEDDESEDSQTEELEREYDNSPVNDDDDHDVTDANFRRSRVSLTAKATVVAGDTVKKPNEADEENLFAGEDDEVHVNEKQVDADLKALEDQYEEASSDVTGYRPYVAPIQTHTSVIEARADELARRNYLTAAEARRMKAIAAKYQTIKNPIDGKGTLADAIVVKPEELTIPENVNILPEIEGVTDPSMLNSSLQVFDSQYITKVLPKDIAGAVMAIQSAGVAIQSYDITRVEDLTDCFDVHTVKVVPVVGKSTTIRFRVPVIDKDGIFKAGGTKYRMRKQRADVPIRKVAPGSVALTSYYSKMFVNLSERMTFNYGKWLINQLMSAGMDDMNDLVTALRPAVCFTPDHRLPHVYCAISQALSSFTSRERTFFFNWKEAEGRFGHSLAKTDSMVPCGTGKGSVLLMDFDNVIYEVSNVDHKAPAKRLGYIEEITGIDISKRPAEVAELDLFGKAIPIGFILAHKIGLGNLIATLGSKVRRVKRGGNYALGIDDFILKFEDEALIFDRKDKIATFVFNGFNRYRNDIKTHSVYAFDKPDVFGAILFTNGIGARHVREMDTLHNLWIDPITKGLLEEMKEPTNLFDLYISALKKLLTDEHPDPMDTAFQRDRGYERVAGMVYGEITGALRVYNSKALNVNASVDLNPEAVWFSVLQDQTVMPIEESNPVHALKEKEVVVYRGQGGRSGQSMTGVTRIFHPNGLGVVSEATVDNGDVGTITYLTANPNYASVRGTTRRLDQVEGNIARVVSTSMMLAPGADHDD